MESFDRKMHCEQIYLTKQLNEVSWYQPTSETSLVFFKQFKVPATAKVIDVGCGDSLLVDHLLDLGSQVITVLDISEAAIHRAMQRLGDKAEKVKWIIADAAKFQPNERYDFWHDGAAFHFLTDEQEISEYLKTAQKSIQPKGLMGIGTFSEQGSTKCSGIEIKQYSENTMTERLKKYFEKIKCFTIDHITPSEKIQQFVFCSFRKLNAV